MVATTGFLRDEKPKDLPRSPWEDFGDTYFGSNFNMKCPPKHHSDIYSDPDYSHVNENHEEKTPKPQL